MKLWIAMLIMALTTYLIRSIPLVFFRKEVKNRFAKGILHYIPYACLTSMTIPAIFYATGAQTGAAFATAASLHAFIAAGVGFIVALIMGWNKKSLPIVALFSCLAVLIADRLLILL